MLHKLESLKEKMASNVKRLYEKWLWSGKSVNAIFWLSMAYGVGCTKGRWPQAVCTTGCRRVGHGHGWPGLNFREYMATPCHTPMLSLSYHLGFKMTENLKRTTIINSYSYKV
jgi:hypothetical protein